MPNFKKPGGSPTKPPPPPRAGTPSRAPVPAGRANVPAAPKSGGKGWAEVARRSKVSSLKSGSKRPAYLDIKNKFIISDGDIVTVQFLDDEPVCVKGCNVPSANFDFYVSRKEVDKSCPMLDAGLKETWKAGFRILDYRGEYDKATKKHKPNSAPQEKIWLVSNTVATQLLDIQSRKNKPLTRMVLDVSRKGSGKDTVYNFDTAREDPSDDESPVMKPIPHTPALPELTEVLKPLSRQQLELVLGNEEALDDTDAEIDTD
jgi:hypothetical protein